MESVYKRCNNCGYECHCGIPLYKTVQNYNEPEFEIKVCNHCTCKEQKDEHNEF
jgi:hypothetical protein